MITIGPDEKIVLKARRHWLPFVSEVMGMVILALIPLGAYSVILGSSFFVLPGDPAYLLLALEPLWILFVWLMFCKFWTGYHLDVWVITNKRLIDIEQKGYFSREVSTIRLDKIQDITVSVNGLIRSLLKFGKITIQSAGETEFVFTMSNMADPYHVKDVLTKLSDMAIEKFENPGVAD